MILGKLVVFEGVDGSGKSTQMEMLCNRLADEGRDFMRVRFPRYDEPSSALINMYLRGEFGDDPDSVNAYAASSFFAVDRVASFLQDWRGYYEGGGFIITDRYTTSNAIHQGAKIPDGQREVFFKWLYEYEFHYMGLPAPDMVIYMDIESETAARRLKKRQSETGTAGDIHETDISYLEQCVLTGKQASEFYAWQKIASFAVGLEKTVEEIHMEIYNLVSHYI